MNPTTPKPEPAEEPPMPAPGWKPEIEEPDPDLLPDEAPTPNPDENRDPPMHTGRQGDDHDAR